MLQQTKESNQEITLSRFSSCKRHVSSSTRFSNLSFASLSAPVSLAALMRRKYI